ncbi:polymer-forming cytoskeletal protein [Falsiroseomonas sp.]|uniref:bactofilin family protein n=1 Tax=Falsiroseomonas sp. TaxID=2870721 RepID=UPI00356266C5
MNVFSRRRDEKPPEPQHATVPTARDPDLGAPPPPFSTRDNQAMSLATKPGNAPIMPAGPTPPSGTAIPPRPAQMGGLGMPSASTAPAAASVGPAPRSTADRRTLVVGRGISLQGTVAEAERLVVEGMVESQMIQATELSISETGVFKGEVQVEDAEIAGTFDGTITARGQLVIRGTGRVVGVARCRRLMVEEGGQISGRMDMLGDQPAAPAMPAPQPVPAEA